MRIYVGLNIKSLLVTFFTSKTLTAYFGDFFVLSGTALAISFLTSLSLDSIRLVSFHVKYEKRKVEIFVLTMFLLEGNNRTTNIDSGGGYCEITVQRSTPRDVKWPIKSLQN